jgi:transposase
MGMSTDVPHPNDSRPLKVTFKPAPGTVVVPSDDLNGIAIRVPVVRVPASQLSNDAKPKPAAAPEPGAATTTPPPMSATPHEPRKISADALPDDPLLLKQMILEILDLLNKKDRENESLKHRLELLVRRLYGVRSEKFDPNQPLLFPEMNPAVDAADTPASPPPETANVDEEPAQPKRKGHGRKGLPKNLRREQHRHELPEDQRQCPCCKVACVQFGEDVSEQLDYIPASVFVHVHTRCKYACPKCHDYVIVADKPAQPIDKGIPGPGMLAQVIVSKYADHLPLHRLERIFARHGVELARSTMCGWMKAAAELFEPLYDILLSQVLLSKVVHTDDTKVPHQDPDNPGKTKSARMWGYFGDDEHPYNVFDFTLDWSRDGPRELLAGFRGFLQADGLSGYDTMGATTSIDGNAAIDRTVLRAGCWAHARRHFFDAKDSDPARAAETLARIGRLYAVEKEAKEIIAKETLTGDAATAVRLRLRQEKSLPELTSLCHWLKQEQAKVLPKSPFGEAVRYALNQWEALERYAHYGFLDIDNNLAERELRPIAIGRNNWLFVGSATGGRTAAILFTMTSTCRRLRIDPFAYLRDALTRLAAGPLTEAELLQLLPTNRTPPPTPNA